MFLLSCFFILLPFVGHSGFFSYKNEAYSSVLATTDDLI